MPNSALIPWKIIVEARLTYPLSRSTTEDLTKMNRDIKNLVSAFCIALVAGIPLFGISMDSYAQTYRSGQHLEPAFEGWRENEDGTFSFIFGYMNENWEEELNIPVGENNHFSPGDPERGQPTHFLPRRNRFTFEVVVPSDWGDKELVWTLTSPNGVVRQAYASLARDYVVDNVVIASETGSLGPGTSSPESRSNTPPEVSIIGDPIRTVQVGQPLRISTEVHDDGLPRTVNIMEQARRFARATGAGAAAAFITPDAVNKMRMMRPPQKITVGKINGLYLSWNVYRGDGAVQFNPPQSKVWEDTRAGSNSPWGGLWTPPAIPENGVYEVEVTFQEPGRYVLWARADDGGLFHDQYIEVNVTP